MSTQELTKLEVIQKVMSKRLKQRQAANLLDLSMRKVKRLVKRYRELGAVGLASKHRGRPSNRRYDDEFKTRVMKIVRENYVDFGPTLAAEKLFERQKIFINKETLRQWMIEAGLRQRKNQKPIKVHQQRARRCSFGELIQIDGSHHDWFEGRAEKCCLIVFIDDATSKLVALRFEPNESGLSYFNTMRDYLVEYGRPLAFYSDKHGIFRINIKEAQLGTGETQFARAMRELDIKIICANSPEAKGRVERANGTLQDRLVKELRLRGISDIESANAFLPKFIADYNNRFAVEPANPQDVHRKTLPGEDEMNLIFTFQAGRVLSKNLEISYNNVIYQIKTDGKDRRLRYAKVTVCDNQKGNVTILYNGSALSYETFDKKNRPLQAISKKEVQNEMGIMLKDSKPREWKQKPDHPWRKGYQAAEKTKALKALRKEAALREAARLPTGSTSLTEAK